MRSLKGVNLTDCVGGIGYTYHVLNPYHWKHKFVIFLSSTAICYFAHDKFEVIRVAIVDNKVYGGSMQATWLEC